MAVDSTDHAALIEGANEAIVDQALKINSGPLRELRELLRSLVGEVLLFA